MIKAQHKRFWIWFFYSYGRFMQKTHFRKISVISEDSFGKDLPVILIQNHFSKWDGYWSLYLSKTFFSRRFHAMMLEENLKKLMFLNRVGVFSVRRNSREMIESLSYTAELLQDATNLVTIYPTGIMLSQHHQNFVFLKGFVRIADDRKNKSLLAMAVILVDYFGFARPEVRIYLKNYSGERTAEAIENAYKEFYQSCILKQTE